MGAGRGEAEEGFGAAGLLVAAVIGVALLLLVAMAVQSRGHPGRNGPFVPRSSEAAR
jgi:hypothetical protein